MFGRVEVEAGGTLPTNGDITHAVVKQLAVCGVRQKLVLANASAGHVGYVAGHAALRDVITVQLGLHVRQRQDSRDNVKDFSIVTDRKIHIMKDELDNYDGFLNILLYLELVPKAELMLRDNLVLQL